MSITTNKSSIYLVSPDSKYDVMDPWTSFMEEDFTIYLKARVLVDELDRNVEGFIIARNGKHAGLSTYRDDQNNVYIAFNYWFWKPNQIEESDGSISYGDPTPVQRKIVYTLTSENKDLSNEYLAVCNHAIRKMFFYVNNELIGEIDYEGLNKECYAKAYMWIGCGSMLTPNREHANIGAYEYDLLFCLNKSISLEEANDLKDNYRESYIDDYFGFPILNSKTPHKENLFFFFNFEQQTEYKVWNLCFNGCYMGFYIENNTVF